jgi:hypothetical protein
MRKRASRGGTPLQIKANLEQAPFPTAGKGVGIPYPRGFSLKKVRAVFKRHHHLEFRSETASVLRTASVVSANEFHGFLKETVKV